jgi:hypothetical protein
VRLEHSNVNSRQIRQCSFRAAFVLDNVHRPDRNRNLWCQLQPLKPLVIDRDKALVNAVSMKAVAEERKG